MCSRVLYTVDNKASYGVAAIPACRSDRDDGRGVTTTTGGRQAASAVQTDPGTHHV